MIEAAAYLERNQTLTFIESHSSWFEDAIVYLILESCSFRKVRAPSIEMTLQIQGHCMISVHGYLKELDLA